MADWPWPRASHTAQRAVEWNARTSHQPPIDRRTFSGLPPEAWAAMPRNVNEGPPRARFSQTPLDGPSVEWAADPALDAQPPPAGWQSGARFSNIQLSRQDTAKKLTDLSLSQFMDQVKTDVDQRVRQTGEDPLVDATVFRQFPPEEDPCVETATKPEKDPNERPSDLLYPHLECPPFRPPQDRYPFFENVQPAFGHPNHHQVWAHYAVQDSPLQPGNYTPWKDQWEFLDAAGREAFLAAHQPQPPVAAYPRSVQKIRTDQLEEPFLKVPYGLKRINYTSLYSGRTKVDK